MTTPAMELSPLVTALLAVAVVITVAQLLGQLADRLGQPRVLGDIVGGILLGPSLLGALQPQLSAWLFSPAVRTQLNLLGQLGLVLFMFLVGLELNPRLLQGRIPLASRVTTVGVLLPLLLGLALAYGFEGWQPDLLPGDHSVAGALFMGTAMAITAFPVLARILAERNLMGQPLGALAITAPPSTTWWAGACWRRWWPSAAPVPPWGPCPPWSARPFTPRCCCWPPPPCAGGWSAAIAR